MANKILVALFGVIGLAVAQRPTVTLNDGVYVGTTISVPSATVAVDAFYGIPYSAPNPERFGAPLPRPKGTETYEATKQPPACIQQQLLPVGAGQPESEDCLFLHVFTPQIKTQNKTDGGKTVMVFFHGGGLAMGGIRNSDGSVFAAKDDIIIVIPSYRLSVWGFPGDVPGLSPEGLNPGFRDQKLSLRWVQDNIAQFGGDPKKVTIFGQSGGAVSVDSHLVSAVDNPPFRAAISMSGGLHTATTIFRGVGVIMTGNGVGNEEGVPAFHTLAKALGCSIENAVPCVRAKPVEDVKKVVANLKLSFVPTDDGGKTMVWKHDSARRAKKVAKVPVMIGATSQEGLMFASQGKTKTLQQWASTIYPNSPANQKAVVDAYSGKEFNNTSDAIMKLHSEYQFACIAAYEAERIASTGVPTWRYFFDPDIPGGAGHSSDLRFVWGTQTGANAELGRKVHKAYADFAKDPTAGPGWPQMGSGEKDVANMGGQGDRQSITMITRGAIDSRCSVWYDSYDPDRPKA